jgi:transcriptional regulator with XRE-family HTH domain
MMEKFLKAMKKKGLTYVQIGEAISPGKYARQTAFNILHGRRSASLKTLIKIGEILDIDEVEVFKIWRSSKIT